VGRLAGKNETCASTAAVPKLSPNTVMKNAPTVGPLRGSMALMTGPSYLKVTCGDSAFCPSTDTLMLCPMPEPDAILHWMVCGEAELLLPVETLVHAVEPTETWIKLEFTPKFVPKTVRVPPPAAGWFGGAKEAITGALYVNMDAAVTD
jgi:hypothetical protein